MVMIYPEKKNENDTFYYRKRLPGMPEPHPSGAGEV
jgi:hypothetical protein